MEIVHMVNCDFPVNAMLRLYLNNHHHNLPQRERAANRHRLRINSSHPHFLSILISKAYVAIVAEYF